MDKSAKIFDETIRVGYNIKRHKMSLKFSGLINMDVLKKLNTVSEE